jgi:hypothetical protein
MTGYLSKPWVMNREGAAKGVFNPFVQRKLEDIVPAKLQVKVSLFSVESNFLYYILIAALLQPDSPSLLTACSKLLLHICIALIDFNIIMSAPHTSQHHHKSTTLMTPPPPFDSVAFFSLLLSLLCAVLLMN